MARARNIKPGFFRNADLVDLPMETRLLFIGLWTLADREGRLEDRPKQIKMEIFPADNVDCDVCLNSLSEIGMVIRYEVDGKRYLQVANFTKHQNPHRDEKASTIPDQNGHVTETVQAPKKHRASTVQAPCKEDAGTVAIGLIPDSLIPDSPSLIPNSKPSAKETRLDASLEAFDEFWSAYPSRPGSSKADSLKAWKARIKEGAEPSALVEGAVKYAAYCIAAAIESKFIKQPATFLGPGEHYLSDWTVPAQRASPAYQSIHDKRAETIAILTGKKSHERTNANERDITGESRRVAG